MFDRCHVIKSDHHDEPKQVESARGDFELNKVSVNFNVKGNTTKLGDFF